MSGDEFSFRSSVLKLMEVATPQQT